MAPGPTPKLAVFELDHALIQGGVELYARCLAAALQDQFGIPNPFTRSTYGQLVCSGTPIEGKTDPALVRLALQPYGVPSWTIREWQQPLLNRATELFSQYLDTDPYVRPAAGAWKTVRALADQGVALGVFTPRSGDIARLLLQHGGFFDWLPAGAYGDEALRFGDLVQRALTQTADYHSLPGTSLKALVVGTSPLTVAAARHLGARPVAVATGVYSLQELRATQAALALGSLVNAHRPLWKALEA